MSKEQSKSNINWGGVTNTLLATGAIVGGLILVAPGTMQNIADSISNVFTKGDAKFDRDASAIAKVVNEDPAFSGASEEARALETANRLQKAVDAAKPNLIERGVGAITGGITNTIGNLIAKVAGGVIAVMGLNYLVNGKAPSNNSGEHAERYAEQKESFAIREDIRKMQAVMMARMQAAGHEPAQAGGRHA